MIAGLAAAWLFDLSTLEGLLLGAILASTDGAAIFALLRGSTLRRRLARTLEGESGFNDPVAVLLVLGFIEWIQEPDYGIADMAGPVRRASSAIGLAVGRRGRLAGASQAFRRARLATRRPLPGRLAGDRRRSRSALADALHGSGFLAVYLAGLALGGAAIPAKRTIAAFHEGLALGRAARDVPHARPARLPEPARRRRARGHGARARRSSLVARPARRRSSRRCRSASRSREQRRARLGRPARRGARRARDLPGDRGRARAAGEFFNIVFFAVLLSTLLQGTTFERARAAARGDDERAGAAAAARRGGHDPAARRRGPRVPGRGRTTRSSGAPRARPRAAARRGRQRDRARRPGDPAARLDAAARRRPAPRARPPGGRATVSATCSSAGATARSARRRGRRAARAAARPIFSRVALAPRTTATRRTRTRSAASRSSSSCASAATSAAGCGCSRTAATPSPARSAAIGGRDELSQLGAAADAPREPGRARLAADRHRRAWPPTCRSERRGAAARR